MKHIQSCLWSNFRTLPSVYSSDFSRHDWFTPASSLPSEAALHSHLCLLQENHSAVQSKTWLSVYLQRKKPFLLILKKTSSSQINFFKTKHSVLFLFSLLLLPLMSNFHCTMAGESNTCNMEQVIFAWHNHHCFKCEQTKKKIKTMATGLKMLMPPPKDKRGQQWDKKKAGQI